MKPLVTIFILVYNNADQLDTTVESVLSQDYDNAEIIISDDGSTKYDTSILHEYEEKFRKRYHQVRVNINEQNVGTVKHLNRVFHMAEGKYLFSCSSGDRYAADNVISSLVERFEKTDALLITTKRIDEYTDAPARVRPSGLVGVALNLFPGLLLKYMIDKKNVLSGCCTFYSKKLFETEGYLDERYHLVEDYPLYVKLLSKGVKIHWYGIKSVVHTIGGVSTGHIHPSIYKDIELLRSEYKKD